MVESIFTAAAAEEGGNNQELTPIQSRRQNFFFNTFFLDFPSFCLASPPEKQINLSRLSKGVAQPGVCVCVKVCRHCSEQTSCLSSQLLAQRRDCGEQREQASHHHHQLAAAFRGQWEDHG